MRPPSPPTGQCPTNASPSPSATSGTTSLRAPTTESRRATPTRNTANAANSAPPMAVAAGAIDSGCEPAEPVRELVVPQERVGRRAETGQGHLRQRHELQGDGHACRHETYRERAHRRPSAPFDDERGDADGGSDTGERRERPRIDGAERQGAPDHRRNRPGQQRPMHPARLRALRRAGHRRPHNEGLIAVRLCPACAIPRRQVRIAASRVRLKPARVRLKPARVRLKPDITGILRCGRSSS